MIALLGMLFLMIFPMFGQPIDPIVDLSDWVARFPELISSLPGVIAQVLFLPAILIGFFNIEKKQFKYLLTGGVILALTLVSYFMDVGFLYGAKFWFVGLTFAILLVGQVIGYALIPGIFNLISDKLNPWKPK